MSSTYQTLEKRRERKGKEADRGRKGKGFRMQTK
jgi:hypothetical protein